MHGRLHSSGEIVAAVRRKLDFFDIELAPIARGQEELQSTGVASYNHAIGGEDSDWT